MSTLNARYAHTSLCLRHLFANLDDDSCADAKIVEFVIGSEIDDALVGQVLTPQPEVAAFVHASRFDRWRRSEHCAAKRYASTSKATFAGDSGVATFDA